MMGDKCIPQLSEINVSTVLYYDEQEQPFFSATNITEHKKYLYFWGIRTRIAN